MSSRLLFAKQFLQANAQRLFQRLRAIAQSLRFRPGKLANVQFIRFVSYLEIEADLAQLELPAEARIIEFGGSNGVIADMLEPDQQVEVAPNYPDVDIQSLCQYDDECCDFVILDQILEHVAAPSRAVDEIFRILRPGGYCLCTTPFLIRVHGYPHDFQRFTSEGLKVLFGKFESVEVSGWGNRLTLETINRYGWLSAKNTRFLGRVALWNETDWPITYTTWARKGRSEPATD